MSKTSRLKKLQDWYDEDITESSPWRKRALESYRFYTGYRQWELADIEKLDEEGRPHLTIPLVFPIVNTLWGHQVANRQDFRLFPRRGGSAAVAALGTELLKHTLDISDGEENQTDVFLDGLIGAVGVVGIDRRRQYDKINGELLVRKKSPFTILFDQNAREYDFNESGRRVTEEMWLSANQIELGYNKSIKDIKEAAGAPKFDKEKVFTEEDYAESNAVAATARDQYLIKKCQWREWKKNVYLVDLQNWSTKLLIGPKVIAFAKRAVGFHKLQARDLGKDPRLAIIERSGWFMYETHYVGDMQLYHKPNPWNGIMEFSLVPFYPYFADGYALGAIDQLKDCQRELNKRVSQELHILNTTANAGWEVKDGKDDEAMQDLKEGGAKGGFVLDHSKFGGWAQKIKPNTLPAGHAYMADQHERYLDRISGVDPNMRGVTERKESGKALNIRMGASLTVAAGIFANFKRTQKTVGKFLWNVISQKDETGESVVYSRKEIESIVQEATIKEFMQMDPNTGQPVLDPATGRPVLDLSPFYADDIGHYGLKVTTSPSSETVRIENLDHLLRIAEKYPPGPDGRPVIPPEFLIELTDIARKEELIERLKQMGQQAAGVA